MSSNFVDFGTGANDDKESRDQDDYSENGTVAPATPSRMSSSRINSVRRSVENNRSSSSLSKESPQPIPFSVNQVTSQRNNNNSSDVSKAVQQTVEQTKKLSQSKIKFIELVSGETGIKSKSLIKEKPDNNKKNTIEERFSDILQFGYDNAMLKIMQMTTFVDDLKKNSGTVKGDTTEFFFQQIFKEYSEDLEFIMLLARYTSFLMNNRKFVLGTRNDEKECCRGPTRYQILNYMRLDNMLLGELACFFYYKHNNLQPLLVQDLGFE